MPQSAMHNITPATAKGLRLFTAIMSTAIVVVLLIAMAALKSSSVKTRPTVDIKALPGPVNVQELADNRAIGPLGMVVAVPSGNWLQWAYIDGKGEVSGSPAAEREDTTIESVVKAWLAADYLSRNSSPSQGRLDQIRRMVRESNDRDAQALYSASGGDASIKRMVEVCGLNHTSVVSGWWSKTSVTAADTARLGRCISTGKAAGPKWTNWLLGELKEVRGQGAFGITEGLTVATAPTVSYQNGWILDGSEWAVNCLAVTPGWSLAVMQRYPKDLKLEHGARNCAQIATQLILFMQASQTAG